jgi:hypothetical protein
MSDGVDLAEIYGAAPKGHPVDADDVYRLSRWTEWMTGGTVGVEHQTTGVERPYWVGMGSGEQFRKGESKGGRHDRAFVFYAHAGIDFAGRAGILVPAWVRAKLETATGRLEAYDRIELADRGSTRGEGVFNSRVCFTHGGMVGNASPRETCGRCYPFVDDAYLTEEGK